MMLTSVCRKTVYPDKLFYIIAHCTGFVVTFFVQQNIQPLFCRKAVAQMRKKARIFGKYGLSVFFIAVIPLTHHKNSGYTELRVLGVYLSPAAGGGKI